MKHSKYFFSQAIISAEGRKASREDIMGWGRIMSLNKIENHINNKKLEE